MAICNGQYLLAVGLNCYIFLSQLFILGVTVCAVDSISDTYIDVICNSADPDRPKNDKATILVDAIQLLKDLTSQVNKLKTEYATLTEESREVI